MGLPESCLGNMQKLSFKLLIRRCVLATLFLPFLQIYRAWYTVVIRLAVRLFRKYPAITAVYLRRGSAKGEIIPLVSDIDFAVITQSMSDDDTQELSWRYQRLAQITTLLDQSLEVYDEEMFTKLYETDYFFQYRFMEGKTTWKLLYGKDYLTQIPSLSIEQLYGGFYTEMKTWWLLFAWRFFQDKKYNQETVTQNNLCYKAVSEILKMNLGLNHHILTFDRQEALRLSKAALSHLDQEFLEKLETIARKQFRIADTGILDDTNAFLLRYLNRFYQQFCTHPLARSLRHMHYYVDCPPEEWFWTDDERQYVAKLVAYVKERWPRTCQGAYVAWSIYFNMDELLFFIAIDPQRLPSVQEIAELMRWHRREPFQQQFRITLYLLLPNAALQLNPVALDKSWQAIVCPPSNPEIFALLNRSACTLYGERYPRTTSAAWTPLVEHFLREEQRLFYELLENPAVYKLNNLDFLRIFWKTLQLVVINRSIQKGEICYPLTLPAVTRALAAAGVLLPAPLLCLEKAYRNECKGHTTDIAGLIPLAMQFLKKMNA